MSVIAVSPAAVAVSSPPRRPARPFHAAIEGLVLLLVCFAPWPFGSVHPLFEFVLLAGVAVLVVLWGLTVLVDWRFTWKRCPVALCLAGLIFVGVAQIAPLPPALLSWLSPARELLLQQLEPAAPEQLADGEPHEAVSLPAASRLSLYPFATRLAVLQLLAVFLLFAVVHNTIASKESLRRLSLACLINGSMLALFALVQFFTTQRHVVFWIYPTSGQVFGPFIDRNQFAFFVNVCICLTGGLLVSYWLRRRDLRDLSWSTPLQHAPTLWLGVFLLLMLTSVAFCLSRGGLLSLFLGCLTAVSVHWTYNSRRSWQEPVWAAVVLLGAGLFVWYALPRLEPRLAMLWHNTTQDSRLSVWLNALWISRDYPWTGTGYGTFGYMELSRRSPGDDPHLIYFNAHNDFVEALAEGGLPRLLLSVAAIVWMYLLGARAYRRYSAHPAGGLVLGAIAAFTTVVIHSFFEFGLHLPAVALLATVLAAQLAALGARRSPENLPEQYDFRLFGFGPLLATAALLLLAGTLATEGWRFAQAERFRLAAQYRDLQRPEESHAPQVAYLQTAVRYSPDDALLRVALAEAHIWQAGSTHEPSQRAAAARQLLAARDLCPLLIQAQVKLAALTDEFSAADPAPIYLQRATLLGPTDPQLWYLRGSSEQKAGDQVAAWKSWRRCLELSDLYLPDVLKQLGDKPDAAAVAEQLLPANAEMLVAAAQKLYPDEADASLRRPLLQRAVNVLQQRAGAQAKDLYVRGRIQAGLGDRVAAVESYRLALARDGSQSQWRFEMAQLLVAEGKLKEAEQELLRVEREKPNDAETKALLEKLRRELR